MYDATAIRMISIILVNFFAEGNTHRHASPVSQRPLYTLVRSRDPEYSHESVLDFEGTFRVQWTPDLEREEVTFEVSARTLGWIGFGFSTSGGMRGADMVTAWVKDDYLVLQDRHGVGDCVPPVDARQDWEPLFARENETHTTVSFKRKINTCDAHDLVFTNETMRMIYAYGDEDPIDQDPPYHRYQRGNRHVLLLLPYHHEDLTEDIQSWRVSQTKVIPRDKNTFYWCHVEKIPKWDKKHHFVGFKMLYGKNARNHLHHSVAFECATNNASRPEEFFEKHVGHEGYECYTPNMPPEFFFCERFLINWAIGSEGEMLPENVGYPLGDEFGGPTYLLFQTHYDNPSHLRGIEVSWAMDMYHTEELRKEEAGNIGLGHSILFSLTVPPAVPLWKTTGHCASQCTSAVLPEAGVRVFTVFLHGHYLAKAIRLRHFRGAQELPPISEDSYFDSNFQQSRRLQKEVTILPGDHLTVECDYDSSDRTRATFSGWSSRDEMCQAFINYYPRINMALCRSSPKPSVIAEVFNIENFPRDLDLYDYILNPRLPDGTLYQDYINSLDIKPAKVKQMNDRLAHGPHYSKCTYNYGRRVEISANETGYPRARLYRRPEEEECRRILNEHWETRERCPTGNRMDSADASSGATVWLPHAEILALLLLSVALW